MANDKKYKIKEIADKNRSCDEHQYQKYKEILGDEAPKSFEDFRKMKYNDTNKYKELETKYNDSVVKNLLKEHDIELLIKLVINYIVLKIIDQR